MAYTAPTKKDLQVLPGTPAEKLAAQLALIDAEIEAVTLGQIELSSGEILVGNGSDEATAVVPAGDVTITNEGVTAIGAKKVTESQIALAEGKVFIGASGGAAAAQTPAGDVTIAVDGTTAIGSKKVGKAMLVSEAADVAGNIFVSTGSESGIDEVAVSGDATLAANGALSLAKHKSKYAVLSAGLGTITALGTAGADLADGNDTQYYGVFFAPAALTAVKLHYYLTEAYVKESVDAVIEVYNDAESPAKIFGATLNEAGLAVKTHGEISPETGAETIAEGTRLDLKITATDSSSGTGHAVVILEYTEA